MKTMLRTPLSIALILFAVTSYAEQPHDDAAHDVLLEQQLQQQVPVQATPLAAGSAVPYINPADNGGSQLDSSAGLGEPLNVIISALSSPDVLTTKGLENWARSVGFSTECLGFHIGNPQKANLGDGLGWQNEIAVLRWDYDNAITGTCCESIRGGNHFRFWRQATTGAYFLAVSVEQSAHEHHNIVPDGYDLGRDALVLRATGKTKYLNNQYSTTSYFVDGLLKPGFEGVNHNITLDGRVAILTVTKIK